MKDYFVITCEGQVQDHDLDPIVSIFNNELNHH